MSKKRTNYQPQAGGKLETSLAMASMRMTAWGEKMKSFVSRVAGHSDPDEARAAAALEAAALKRARKQEFRKKQRGYHLSSFLGIMVAALVAGTFFVQLTGLLRELRDAPPAPSLKCKEPATPANKRQEKGGNKNG